MKRHIVTGLLGLVCGGIGVSALQQTSNKVFVYGVGASSCGAWTESREAARTRLTDVRVPQFEIWVDGFLSGYDWFVPGTHVSAGIVKTDRAGMRGYFDNYCRENPTATFAAAAHHFIESQGGKVP